MIGNIKRTFLPKTGMQEKQLEQVYKVDHFQQIFLNVFS